MHIEYARRHGARTSGEQRDVVRVSDRNCRRKLVPRRELKIGRCIWARTRPRSFPSFYGGSGGFVDPEGVLCGRKFREPHQRPRTASLSKVSAKYRKPARAADRDPSEDLQLLHFGLLRIVLGVDVSHVEGPVAIDLNHR